MRKMLSIWILVLIAFMVMGFSKKPVKVVEKEPVTVLEPIVIEEPKLERISLYWENTTEPHPYRAAWSDELIKILKQDLELYSTKAKDIKEVCPKFFTITETQKLKALGEFWVAMAYYESAFKPGQYSVDVGTKNNKETWSVGLYQMSGTDNAAKKYGATFEKLKDPIININVALDQMRRQLNNTGEIFLHKSSRYRYWAVILEQGKYSKISEIKARTKKQVPYCF